MIASLGYITRTLKFILSEGISSMKPITKFVGVVAAVMTLSTGAFAADTKCGTIPVIPDAPADGAALTSKDMDALANTFDEYQSKFAAVNKCAVEEYNAATAKFEAAVEAYAAKNSKKK